MDQYGRPQIVVDDDLFPWVGTFSWMLSNSRDASPRARLTLSSRGWDYIYLNRLCFVLTPLSPIERDWMMNHPDELYTRMKSLPRLTTKNGNPFDCRADNLVLRKRIPIGGGTRPLTPTPLEMFRALAPTQVSPTPPLERTHYSNNPSELAYYWTRPEEWAALDPQTQFSLSRQPQTLEAQQKQKMKALKKLERMGVDVDSLHAPEPGSYEAEVEARQEALSKMSVKDILDHATRRDTPPTSPAEPPTPTTPAKSNSMLELAKRMMADTPPDQVPAWGQQINGPADPPERSEGRSSEGQKDPAEGGNGDGRPEEPASLP